MLTRDTGGVVYIDEAIKTFSTGLALHRHPNRLSGPPATGDHVSTLTELLRMGRRLSSWAR
jgi:hypothetical protein